MENIVDKICIYISALPGPTRFHKKTSMYFLINHPVRTSVHSGGGHPDAAGEDVRAEGGEATPHPQTQGTYTPVDGHYLFHSWVLNLFKIISYMYDAIKVI